MRTFTISEKENGEFEVRKLTGLAERFAETTSPLDVYEVEEEGLYYTYGSTYKKDAHGPYTVEQLQEEFTALYLAGWEGLFYLHTNGYDLIVYNNDGDVKYHTADDSFPTNPTSAEASDFLEEIDIVNVNPWEDGLPMDELLNGAEIVAEYMF